MPPKTGVYLTMHGDACSVCVEFLQRMDFALENSK